jgi:hypothetical protein
MKRKIAALAIGPMTAVFLSISPTPADAEKGCNGRVVTRTGPGGVALKLCLDGKYTTCLRDSQRLGYSAQSAKRYCDDRKAQGQVR